MFDRVLDEVLAGAPRLLLLTGPAGIGKTRLGEELLAAAAARGARTLTIRHSDDEDLPEYWSVIQALRAYLADTDDATLARVLGPGADDLVRLVPEIRQRLPVPDPPPMPPAQARFRLFDSVRAFFDNAARAGPLAVLEDDLQWANVPTLALLTFLARHVARVPLLGICTYRDAELPPEHPITTGIATLMRESIVTPIALEGLGADDVARLVEAITGRRPSERAAADLVRRTAGNPFFATEVVRPLAADRATDRLARDELGEVVVPAGVREVLHRRIARVLGHLACRLARHDEARQHLENALVRLTDNRMRPLRARTLVEYASLLDDGDHAPRLLREAVALADAVGSEPIAARARALLAGSTSAPPPVVRAQRPSVFRRDGDFWTVAHADVVLRMKDTKGLRYIAHLLRHPRRDIYVLDLVAAVEGGGEAAVRKALAREAPDVVLDARARADYRARLAALEEEIQEAERFGDVGRMARLREEREALAEALSAAFGLGSRERQAASASERARSAVTQNVRAAMKRLVEGNPALGEVLALRIRTGTVCVYVPPADGAIDWDL